MSELDDRLALLSPQHKRALEWFHERTGEVIGWPAPLDGLLLTSKAKGIRAPKDWKHALSVRQTLDSPYADEERVWAPDGSWTYNYFQEGQDPAERDKFHTNRTLLSAAQDDVPVAVLVQERAKPTARYRVLGLARVKGWRGGYFHFEGFTPTGNTSRINSQPSPETVPNEIYIPLSVEDARRRIERQIIARRGGRRFRKNALKNFNSRCVVTSSSVEAALEAAHIVPYLNDDTNTADNALLMRADIHTLFDCRMISINPTDLTVSISGVLSNSEYAVYHGKKLDLPTNFDLDRLSLRLEERALELSKAR